MTIQHNPIDDPAKRTIAWFNSAAMVQRVEAALQAHGVDPVHISTSERDAEELSLPGLPGTDTPGEHWIAVSGPGDARRIAAEVMEGHDPQQLVT